MHSRAARVLIRRLNSGPVGFTAILYIIRSNTTLIFKAKKRHAHAAHDDDAMKIDPSPFRFIGGCLYDDVIFGSFPRDLKIQILPSAFSLRRTSSYAIRVSR